MKLAVVATLAVFVAMPRLVTAQQGRPLTVAELSEIYGSGGDVDGWDWHDITEMVAAVFGPRARDAVIAILTKRPSADSQPTYDLYMALETAKYGRVGVPVAVIKEFLEDDRIGQWRGSIRHNVASVLSWYPDTSLVPLWLQMATEPDVSFRQVAVAGLACALGSASKEHLDYMMRDSREDVVRVAAFYDRQLRTKGDSGLFCGAGRVTRQGAPSFPDQLRPNLRERGAAWLRRIP